MKIKANIKKIITAFALQLAVLMQIPAAMTASAAAEPLQAYFTEDGKTIKIFTETELKETSSVMVANETYNGEVINEDVKVRTTFLIDNSSSIPKDLRDDVKKAISNYVLIMPDNEELKVAVFGKTTTILADEYSVDQEFIDFELDKPSFKSQEALVYDALMHVINDMDKESDIYYRTVLITGGVTSDKGTSFDQLRTLINENERHHVDVVQVSKKDVKDSNLSAIAGLGSNTYKVFTGKLDFRYLRPESVSMIKAKLSNEVTTGELKGVTIKNGSSNISLGSLMFPQVEKATWTEEELADLENAIKEELSSDEESSEGGIGDYLPIIIIAAVGVVAVGAVVAILVVCLKPKKNLNCIVNVEIIKEDTRDIDGTGRTVWKFPTMYEFRVGRILQPVSNNGEKLPVNHAAIMEKATVEDENSIGRNAFSLTYVEKNQIKITNIASSAMFSVKISNSSSEKDMRSNSSEILIAGSEILLGNYTTIRILNIETGK